MERRERLLADLQKMQRRVDEFADNGELNMMAEYAQDVKQTQKKIVEVENEIDWINQVKLHFVPNSLSIQRYVLGRISISNATNRIPTIGSDQNSC